MNKRYVCIHGHFYQPPRENPWLEAIEPQDSAAPVTTTGTSGSPASATRPTASRAFATSGGRIIRVVNNYRQISFNFGATLLSWMAESRARDSGQHRRGRSATAPSVWMVTATPLAQVYNHIIMPLATARRSTHPDHVGHPPTSSTASAATPRACGWPRPRPAPTASRRWPSTVCASPSCRRSRPDASTPG